MSFIVALPIPCQTLWHRHICRDSLTREEDEEEILFNHNPFDCTEIHVTATKINQNTSIKVLDQQNKSHVVHTRIQNYENWDKNLRWALEMQTMTARSRNTLITLDIVGFLFCQDDSVAGKKKPLVFGLKMIERICNKCSKSDERVAK